jgi:hypothetical protein
MVSLHKSVWASTVNCLVDPWHNVPGAQYTAMNEEMVHLIDLCYRICLRKFRAVARDSSNARPQCARSSYDRRLTIGWNLKAWL